MPETHPDVTQRAQSLMQVKRLILPVPTLAATDSISRALHVMASSQASVLPVVSGESLLGVVAEVDLLLWIIRQRGSLGYLAPSKAQDAMVVQVMTTTAVVGYAEESLDTVLPLFEDRRLKALPILDTLGRYQGMLTRQSVLEALTHQVKPPHVAGLATFWGIRLSNGVTHAGVSDGVLLAHGGCLATIMLGTHAAVHACLPKAGGWFLEVVPAVVCVLVLFAVMRLSSWASYHAAEHQVITAIERTEILSEESVKTMPRWHPDCEARVAMLIGLLAVLVSFPALDTRLVIGLLILTWMGQHRLATWLQRHIATRPASARQISKSVQVARQLLATQALWPDVPISPWHRLWHQGAISMGMGAVLVWLLWAMTGLSGH